MKNILPERLSIIRATLSLLYRSNPRAFIISAIASIPEPLFYPTIIFLLQKLFEELSGPNGTVQISSQVALFSFALLATLLIQRLGIIVRDASSTILRQQAWVTISKLVMQKLPSVPYSLFEDNSFQARYGLVVREASYRSITLVDTLLSTGPILLGAIGLAVTLFVIAPLMVLILLVIAIPAALIEQRFSDAMYGLQESTAPARLRLEAITNMQVDALWQRDVRVYRTDLLTREHASLADDYLSQLKQLTARFLGLRGAAASVQVLGLGLALWAISVLINRGQLTLANLAVLIPGTAFLSGMIAAITYHLRSLWESLAYAQTLFDFLSKSFDGTSYITSNSADLPRMAGIRLNSVAYTYPNNQKQALIDISHVFSPGLTAIVGTNGAGKSTLVKLAAGLVAPTQGSIQAVAKTGEEFPLGNYVKAVLFQDPGHFPFSIRHNVTMLFDQTPDEDEAIADALKLAGLWEVIQTMPDGLDTVVGAGFGGVADLSGGQWQRLALARLIYHDAPLIILDEPSASLDPLGERQIFELLTRLAQDKIILFTTHRYDTIRRADTIVVLVDGKIAEVGSPEELEQRAGAFWSLYFGQGSHLGSVAR
ncbi:MAG TPA: ABC transporter ATP-binding protein [Anaerolineales bacterium]|nr:ABC transporter ATP-binding protein [Anaerolineales bacterium]